jgi:hypothetical protein
MSKTAIPLNDKRIKAIKPKAKRYLIADAGGLVLEVMTSGAITWRYCYSLHGKQQPLVTIGEYPSISLQDALERVCNYGRQFPLACPMLPTPRKTEAS